VKASAPFRRKHVHMMKMRQFAPGRGPASRSAAETGWGSRRHGRALALASALALALACRPVPPQGEGSFRVAVGYKPDRLDPQAFTVAAYTALLSNVYEPLVTLDRDLRLRPALAESWSNLDGRTLELRLRQGVHFHGGGSLDSADVVHSLRRALADRGLEVSYYLAGVEDVVAQGPRIVEIHTRRPLAALLNRLAFVPILPRGLGEHVGDRADGTGPFMVEAWRPRESLVLKRYDGYWGPRPWLSRAEIQLGREASAVAEGLHAGRYHMAVLGDASPRESPSGYRIESGPSLHVQYLGFDVSSSATPFCRRTPNPFRDRRVRLAIHLALDRPGLSRVLPEVTPLWQLVPPAVFGFDPTIAEASPDRQQARRLLREAGVFDGFSVTLHTRSFMRSTASWVARQLEPLKIRVDVETPPEERYLEMLRGRRLSFWLDNWGCTTGESGELFENAMHSPDPAGGLGAFNESGFRNQAIDALIETSRETMSTLERRRLLQDVMRRTMSEVPWVPLLEAREYYAVAQPYRYLPRPGRNLDLASVERAAGGG
jgi:peptide/nickel transport system substrate-binding protein